MAAALPDKVDALSNDQDFRCQLTVSSEFIPALACSVSALKGNHEAMTYTGINVGSIFMLSVYFFAHSSLFPTFGSATTKNSALSIE
jgi:hypothetical protein